MWDIDVKKLDILSHENKMLNPEKENTVSTVSYI